MCVYILEVRLFVEGWFVEGSKEGGGGLEGEVIRIGVVRRRL